MVNSDVMEKVVMSQINCFDGYVLVGILSDTKMKEGSLYTSEDNVVGVEPPYEIDIQMLRISKEMSIKKLESFPLYDFHLAYN